METLIFYVLVFFGLVWAVLAIVRTILKKRAIEQIEYNNAMEQLGQTLEEFEKEVEKTRH